MTRTKGVSTPGDGDSCGPVSIAGALERDHVDEALESPKVLGVSRVEGQLRGVGGGGEGQINGPRAAGRSPTGDNRGEDPAVRSSRPNVQGQGINDRFSCCSRSWRLARSLASSVACGPAASSAIVNALMASSTGSWDGSIASRSITTEVSMTPRRWRRGSATRRNVRGRRDRGLRAVDASQREVPLEGRQDGVGSDEAAPRRRAGRVRRPGRRCESPRTSQRRRNLMRAPHCCFEVRVG